MIRIGYHFIAYYLSWVLCIYYAMQDNSYMGFIITGLIMFTQVGVQKFYKQTWRKGINFGLILMMISIAIDSLFLNLNFVSFKANPFSPWISPLWLMTLWFSFGFYFVVNEQKWLNNPYLLALLTLISVPWAYWLAVITGTISIHINLYAYYSVLGLLWSILLPFTYLNLDSICKRFYTWQ